MIVVMFVLVVVVTAMVADTSGRRLPDPLLSEKQLQWVAPCTREGLLPTAALSGR